MYLAHTVPPDHMTTTADTFDNKIRTTFEQIIGVPLTDKAWAQATLPMSRSGFGLRSILRHGSAAYLASTWASKLLLDKLNPTLYQQLSEHIKDARETFQFLSNSTMPESCVTQKTLSKKLDDFQMECNLNGAEHREKARILATSKPHAGAWINALPLPSINTIIPNRLFQISAQRWLGVPLTSTESKCMVCNKPNNNYADHALVCGSRGDRISRHNGLRKVVAQLARNAALNPVEEKAGILGDAPGCRPGDVTILMWHNGEALAIDTAVTAVLQQRFINVDSPAEEYATKEKHAKYDESFAHTAHEFCAMVWKDFGAITKEGEEVIQDLGKMGADHLGYPRGVYIAHCWQTISTELQRSNAKMILSRTLLEEHCWDDGVLGE